jgi:hypothetical protein
MPAEAGALSLARFGADRNLLGDLGSCASRRCLSGLSIGSVDVAECRFADAQNLDELRLDSLDSFRRANGFTDTRTSRIAAPMLSKKWSKTTDRIVGAGPPRTRSPRVVGTFGCYMTLRAGWTWSHLPAMACSSSFLMGRAGFEPATLGLKVPCSTS